MSCWSREDRLIRSTSGHRRLDGGRLCVLQFVLSTITFRADADVDQALAELVSGDRDRSQVIRDAILAAWRARREEQIRAEAEAVAADAADVAEARAVLADMETLRAW